jgi:hypothetical protein
LSRAHPPVDAAECALRHKSYYPATRLSQESGLALDKNEPPGGVLVGDEGQQLGSLLGRDLVALVPANSGRTSWIFRAGITSVVAPCVQPAAVTG